MVGYPEIDSEGNATGKYLRFCLKTEAEAIVQFMAMVKVAVDRGEAKLPFDGVELENACGYMFRGSTEREMYCSKENIVLPNSSVRKQQNGDGFPSPA